MENDQHETFKMFLPLVPTLAKPADNSLIDPVDLRCKMD